MNNKQIFYKSDIFYMSIAQGEAIELAEKKRINSEFVNIVQYCCTFFPNLKLPKGRQIRINVTSQKEKVSVEEPDIAFPGFRSIVYLDYNNDYLGIDPLKKREIALEALRTGILNVFDFMNWDRSLIDSGFAEIYGSKNKFVLPIDKVTINKKNKELSGNLEMEIFAEKRSFYLSVRCQNDIVKIPIVELNNYCFNTILIFDSIIKDGKWIDENNYIAKNNSGEIAFEIDILQKKSTLKLTSVENTLQEELMKRFELSTNCDEEFITQMLSPKLENWQKNSNF